MMKPVWNACIVLWLLAAFSCDGSNTVEPVHYAGSVDGEGSVVAYVPALKLFYVCGASDSALSSTTHWFSTDEQADKLSAADAGWRLSGQRRGSAYAGELLRPDGKTLAWTVQPSLGTDPAGLYIHTDAAGRTGVVLQSNSVLGVVAQGAWAGAGTFAAVTPVRPVVASRASFLVSVLGANPNTQYLVARAGLYD